MKVLVKLNGTKPKKNRNNYTYTKGDNNEEPTTFKFSGPGGEQDLDSNRVETMTPTTGTQMRKAILRSLLRGSTLMKRSKKKDFFLTRNGRIKLIILEMAIVGYA
jgi:hypothetical protein